MTANQVLNANRTVNVHAFSNLSLSAGARLNLVTDLVKTQAGTLTLGGNVTHWVANVYIHQGTVDLRSRILRVNNRITIGDGIRTAILQLAPNRWDQIIRIGGGLPDITLRGGISVTCRAPSTAGRRRSCEWAATPSCILAT